MAKNKFGMDSNHFSVSTHTESETKPKDNIVPSAPVTPVIESKPTEEVTTTEDIAAEEPAVEAATTEPEPTTTPKKKKSTGRPVGRPKTKEPCTNINIAIPNRLLDQVNEVVLGTKVDYITKLIEKDMAENYKRYKAIKDQLENI